MPFESVTNSLKAIIKNSGDFKQTLDKNSFSLRFQFFLKDVAMCACENVETICMTISVTYDLYTANISFLFIALTRQVRIYCVTLSTFMHDTATKQVIV